MTTAERLAAVAENEQKVYAAGGAAALDGFWENLQDGGRRTDYTGAFAGWGSGMAQYFCPKYDIVPTAAFYLFYKFGAVTDLPEFLEQKGLSFDTKNTTDFRYMFSYSQIEHAGVIDTRSATACTGLFDTANRLKTIDELILRDDGSQQFSYTFAYAAAIRDIKITGTIGNDVNLRWSQDLTEASLVSVLSALSKDSTLAGGKSLTLAAKTRTVIEASAAATEQYSASLAAGWTIAFI